MSTRAQTAIKGDSSKIDEEDGVDEQKVFERVKNSDERSFLPKQERRKSRYVHPGSPHE